MNRGNSPRQSNDWFNTFDPRVTGLEGKKGTIFRYSPAVGAPMVLLKQDDGFSVNWLPTGGANQPYVYYVTPGQGDLPTIQSAIDQAFADGSGTGGIVATIYVPPGVYIEDLTFQPGQCFVAQTSQVSVNAIKVQGQHTYTPPVNSDPLSVQVTIQGMSFIDVQPAGDTISILGVEGFFFSLQAVSFTKTSLTGSSLNSVNPTGIFICSGVNSTTYLSADPFIRSTSSVTVLNACSHSSGGSAPMLEYSGSGTVQLLNNQCIGSAPYVIDIQGGTCFANANFLISFAPNNDCIRVGATAFMLITSSTLWSSVGTGYVFQGTGTVNGTLLAYGGSTAKDPGLTFNLLPSDPP